MELFGKLKIKRIKKKLLLKKFMMLSKIQQMLKELTAKLCIFNNLMDMKILLDC